MIIVNNTISLEELKKWENCMSPNWENLVKVVVDIKNSLIAIWWYLHADEEELLLDEWSNQENLWWINLYIQKFNTEDFIEFDSMINIRPNQNNRSRWVEDIYIQNIIKSIINKLIHA